MKCRILYISHFGTDFLMWNTKSQYFTYESLWTDFHTWNMNFLWFRNYNLGRMFEYRILYISSVKIWSQIVLINMEFSVFQLWIHRWRFPCMRYGIIYIHTWKSRSQYFYINWVILYMNIWILHFDFPI